MSKILRADLASATSLEILLGGIIEVGVVIGVGVGIGIGGRVGIGGGVSDVTRVVGSKIVLLLLTFTTKLVVKPLPGLGDGEKLTN